MLLVDATTAEHARGIRTVIAGIVGALAANSPEEVTVVAGPGLAASPPLVTRRVALARSRPGRLLYQRALLPLDVEVLRRRGKAIDRALLLDAYAPIVRPGSGVRYAALVHDVLPLTHPQYWTAAKRLVKRTAFASLRRSVTLFTSSEFNVREIERHLGVEARVVAFGCGQLTDHEAEAALLAALPARRPYFLYVGALEPRKGVISLVDAFERIAREESGLELILAGGGPRAYREALAARINGELHGRVQLLQNPERRTVLDLIAHASVLAMPTHAEGFGLPVLEALALGTPVVASDIPAIRSWAQVAVRYAPPDDANEWAEVLTASLGASDDARRRGQTFAQGFRWRSCAAALGDF